MKRWPFEVVDAAAGKWINYNVYYGGEWKFLSPEKISSLVIANLKKNAETYLGQSVKDAVISVPAHFNNDQRKATREAGAMAGLNVLRIVNETSAAAIAYGFNKKIQVRFCSILELLLSP